MGLRAWLTHSLVRRIAGLSRLEFRSYLAQARYAIRQTKEEVDMPGLKSGWKTTEFWLTLGSILLGTLDAQLGWDLPKESILVLAAYVLNRAWVKGKEADASKTTEE